MIWELNTKKYSKIGKIYIQIIGSGVIDSI